MNFSVTYKAMMKRATDAAAEPTRTPPTPPAGMVATQSQAERYSHGPSDDLFPGPAGLSLSEDWTQYPGVDLLGIKGIGNNQQPQPPQKQGAPAKPEKSFEFWPWLKDNWHTIAIPALGLLGGMALGGKDNRGLGALAGLGLGLGANYFFGDQIRDWANSAWAGNKTTTT